MIKTQLSFNEILPFVAMWMDRGNAVLSQITQTEEKKQNKTLYDITNTWNPKNKQMYMAKWKHTHSKIKQTNGYRGGKGSRKGQVRGMRIRDTHYYA